MLSDELRRVEDFIETQLKWCGVYLSTVQDRVHTLGTTGRWLHSTVRSSRRRRHSSCQDSSERESDEANDTDTDDSCSGFSVVDEHMLTSPSGSSSRYSQYGSVNSYPAVLSDHNYARKTLADFSREVKLIQSFTNANWDSLRYVHVGCNR